jgi:hypothetical protein
VTLVRIHVPEERIASIVRVKGIIELGNVAVTSNSFHFDNGGDNFLRNVDSYKSHTVSRLTRRHSSSICVHKTDYTRWIPRIRKERKPIISSAANCERCISCWSADSLLLNLWMKVNI